MNSLFEWLSEKEVLVKNASGTEEDPKNVIEWYFNGRQPWSSADCPCCGKKMYRQKMYCGKHPVMVGAHVEILNIDLFKGNRYVIPLCEECNNKKNNLQPFKVKLGWLKVAPHST